MSALICHQFPYGNDNYGVLLHDQESGDTACVDAGDADAVLAALQRQSWQLSLLLITHHHADHTAGLATVKAKTGCRVIGPEPLSTFIDGLDETVGDGSEFAFAGRTVRALHTPGHTRDMINYYFADDDLVFTGDTLFSMGCGRLFEGDAATMLASMQKLGQLPQQTQVYCAHEYTATNARFARDVDPENTAVQRRADEVMRLREQNQPTIPTTLKMELETNPFLRCDSASLKASLGMQDADEVAVFAELRERRNGY